MPIVLAFSGGLDTSFCVPYLRETLNEPVFTVTVNTGAITDADQARLQARSLELGAAGHYLIDGRHLLFDDHLRYLIMGNVLRGGVYPLCVGSERVVQARMTVAVARELGARAVAHGSTGAGNDQVRFDVALQLLADDLEIITPIRDNQFTRQHTTAFLEERGFSVPIVTTRYSINSGLWGTTIGGAETLGTRDPLPEEAFPGAALVAQNSRAYQDIKLTFDKGVPVELDGTPMDAVSLIESLNSLGLPFGVGRDMHVGDTILGVKGRVAFEAPAPITLVAAHRELEKIVLTKWQRYQKDHLADFYGMLLHEGQHFDPVMRDIEAFLVSSQQVVTGDVCIRLAGGRVSVQGCESPFSMFNTGVATYGEETEYWNGDDARGFCRIAGMQGYLAHKARTNSS